MAEKIKVVVIAGPTGAGKTALSVGLARTLSAEIIGADSMQIYKGMEIASAAPTEAEKEGIPHHLFGIKEPDERFSVADYVKLAGEKVREINSRGHLPMIVGGAGLYIDSLLGGISFSEEDCGEVRKRLTEEAERVGYAEMLRRLAGIDGEAAAKLHENDKKRIIRGLEVYETHGITPTEMNAKNLENGSPYEPLYIGITCRDREKLYRRIEERADKMVRDGIIEEAAQMREKLGATSVQAIGHKEFYGYLDGTETLEDALAGFKTSTRRYAKRQLTWFGRNPEIKWIYTDECPDLYGEALGMIKEFL